MRDPNQARSCQRLGGSYLMLSRLTELGEGLRNSSARTCTCLAVGTDGRCMRRVLNPHPEALQLQPSSPYRPLMSQRYLDLNTVEMWSNGQEGPTPDKTSGAQNSRSKLRWQPLQKHLSPEQIILDTLNPQPHPTSKQITLLMLNLLSVEI